MNVWKPIAIVAVAGLVASVGLQTANATAKHPNIEAASAALNSATTALDAAQKANEYDLAGHAQKAKGLISQAQSEVAAALSSAR
jgi:type II secretory pathway pseudopilin PulG